MTIHPPDACVIVVREYAEALRVLLQRVIMHIPPLHRPLLADPIERSTTTMAHALRLDASAEIDGLDQVALREALEALQHLSSDLARCRGTGMISPTRHALIGQVHTALIEQLTVRLNGEGSCTSWNLQQAADPAVGIRLRPTLSTMSPFALSKESLP